MNMDWNQKLKSRKKALVLCKRNSNCTVSSKLKTKKWSMFLSKWIYEKLEIKKLEHKNWIVACELKTDEKIKGKAK